jgi:hypothetical protein
MSFSFQERMALNVQKERDDQERDQARLRTKGGNALSAAK